MDTNRLPKQALQYKPKGRRNIGRPRKRWRDQLHLEDHGTGNTPNPSGTWWWWWWRKMCAFCWLLLRKRSLFEHWLLEFLNCPLIFSCQVRGLIPRQVNAGTLERCNTCRYSLLKCGFSAAIMGYQTRSLAFPVLYLESGKNRKPQCPHHVYSYCMLNTLYALKMRKF